MAKHYVTVANKPEIEEHAVRAGAVRERWREDVFDDLLQRGASARVLRLPAKPVHGPQLGIVGQKFYAEAAIDDRRDDAVFIFKIMPLARRPLGSVREYLATFELRLGGASSAPIADSVEPLFGAKRERGRAKIADEQPDLREAVAARWRERLPDNRLSARCERLLRSASREERQKLARAPAPVPEDPVELQRVLAETWRKFRLQTCAPSSLTARQQLLLSKAVQAPSDECAALLDVFSFDLLNRVAHRCETTKDFDRAHFIKLVTTLAELPIRPNVRARIWSESLLGAAADELPRELHESRELLRDGVATGDLGGLGPALADVLSRTGSQRLVAIATEARADELPLRVIAEWVERLEFEVPSAPVEPVGEATIGIASATPVAPLSERGPNAHDVSTLDTWLFSQLGIDVALVDEHRRGVRIALRTFEAALREEISASAIEATERYAREFRGRVDELIALLPKSGRFSEERARATDAFEKAVARIGEARATELLETGIAVDALNEASAILARQALVDAVPSWMWRSSAADSGEHSGWLQIADDIVLRRLRLVSQVVDATRATPADVGALAPPPPGADVDAYIEERLRECADERRFFETVPSRHREWIDESRSQGHSSAQLRDLVDALSRLEPRLSPDAFNEVVAGIRALETAEARLARAAQFERAVVDLTTLLNEEVVRTLQYPLIAKHLPAFERAQPRDDSAVKLRITHQHLDEEHSRAKLVFVRETAAYGYVLAPLLLRSKSRDASEIDLTWEVRGQSAWPKEWPTAGPRQIGIQAHDWLSRGEEFVVPLTAKIYVRPAEIEGRLKVNVGSSAFAQTASLEWTNIEQESAVEGVVVDLSSATDPDHVKRHPLGPQTKLATILDRMRGGRSSAIVAPRRFGKTTLLRFLESDDTSGLLVVSLAPCTSFVAGGKFDVSAFWTDASRRLQDKAGAGIALPLDSDLPGVTAFDGVRAMARSRGISRLVLLVDEAQALFRSGAPGAELGDRLKDRIAEWSLADSRRAGLAVILAGLPALIRRGGANLVGELMPIHAETIGEAEINRFVLEVTRRRLQTTKGARERLARLSRSILILRTLLERLRERARNERRVWIDERDVRAVEEELSRALRAGEEPGLAPLLRDAFNIAESVNEWEPTDHYPVAVALAAARGENLRRGDDIVKSAQRKLADWGAAEDGPRVTLSEEDVRRHVQQLEETGLLREFEFTSPFVEAWLRSQESKSDTDEFRDALLRAGTPRIRRPVSLERVGEGAQASVWLYERDGVQYAYRESELKTEEQRTRFAETRTMLLALRRRLDRREAGSECVFDLKQVGLRDDDAHIAVQIYRWIDGVDLGKREAQLEDSAVVHIGVKLAAGVSWLHASGVLHRDIRPANVVLSHHGLQPVLIDFGLARADGIAAKTVLGTDCAAPEVRQGEARWSKAADVFALAATLDALRRRRERALTEVLAPFKAVAEATRGSADELHKALANLEASMRVNANVRETYSRRVEDWLKLDGTPFLRTVAEKFKPRFEAAFLGIPAEEDRAADAANFLNQVLEAWCAQRGMQGLSLSAAAEEWNQDALRVAGTLRNDGVHFRRRTRLGNQTPREVIQEAARALNARLGTKHVFELAGAFFP